METQLNSYITKCLEYVLNMSQNQYWIGRVTLQVVRRQLAIAAARV
jgi:hypothetical protein